MTKSLRIGLACFVISYIALSLLAASLLPEDGWLATDWANCLVVCAAVALACVLIALAAGRLTVTGTAMCALLVQLAFFAAVVGVFVALSSRGKGTIVWPLLLGASLARVWRGWLPGAAAAVVWPVFWLVLIRRAVPKLAASPRSRPFA